MKKLIFSSLIAVLMLNSCTSENKKESADTTDTITASTPPPPVEDTSKTVAPAPPPVAKETDQKVYNFAAMENPPTYPGGMPEFYKFISSNLKYPEAAEKNKVQGSVLVSFMIEEDGTLADVKVDRKLGSGTDEEAIRVLNLSKKWNPGMIDGKAVRTKFNIPVKFSLSK